MPGLPPPPLHLRIFPSRLAAERAVRPAPGECLATTDLTTFGALLRTLGSLGGRRYASRLLARLLVRDAMLNGRAGTWVHDAAHDAYAVRAVQRSVDELRIAGITARHFAAQRVSPELGT